jgi:hypothetical protein
MKTVIAALATLSLAGAAVPAAAAPAATSPVSALSIAKSDTVRVGTRTKGKSNLSVLENPVVSVAIGAAAIVGILAVAGALGDSDSPDTADSN